MAETEGVPVSVLSRIIQPLATATIALALLFVAVFWRPFSPPQVHVARGVGHQTDMLPTGNYVDAAATQSYDSTFDSMVLTVFVGGLTLILIGSLYLIWHRARLSPGRHRAAA